MFEPSVHLVFDLDDTLYQEIDYVQSAFAYVGVLVEAAFRVENASEFLHRAFYNGQRDAIGALCAEYGLSHATRNDVIAAMRGHTPAIDLPRDSAKTLSALELRGIKWSILTDGRSLTQRRKIEALGLVGASGIYISEERGVRKPSLKAYTQIIDDNPDANRFCYVADNPAKDFVTPNALGWHTIMLRDRGYNIHPQDIDVPAAFRAHVEISELTNVLFTIGT
jgi:putative hydrolase of the HAD superfamily